MMDGWMDGWVANVQVRDTWAGVWKTFRLVYHLGLSQRAYASSISSPELLGNGAVLACWSVCHPNSGLPGRDPNAHMCAHLCFASGSLTLRP